MYRKLCRLMYLLNFPVEVNIHTIQTTKITNFLPFLKKILSSSRSLLTHIIIPFISGLTLPGYCICFKKIIKKNGETHICEIRVASAISAGVGRRLL